MEIDLAAFWRSRNLYPQPHQWEPIEYQWPESTPPGPVIYKILGGWGSGKTHSAVLLFALAALQRGYVPRYGRKRPEAVVMAPTLELALSRLDAVANALPPSLVLRQWGRPKPRLLLANQLVVSAVSADSVYEGENLVLAWLDEIQHETYANNPIHYTNMVARLRDTTGDHKYLPMIVTGLPTSGFVKDTFDDRPGDTGSKLWLWGTKLNAHLPQSSLDQIKRNTPYGQELTFLDGLWQPIPNALYPQYRADTHLVNQQGNRNGPVDVGMDVGNRSSAVIGQPSPMGLFIADEIIGHEITVHELCDKLRASGWPLVPGKSRIFVDPTIRRDEIYSIRNIFPNIHIIQRERTDEFYDVWRGVRLIQSSLRAADGKVRLTFASHLRQNQNGVIKSLEYLRYNNRTGGMVVDDTRDHANDALRYLVCGVLGRLPAAPEVQRRG